MLHRTSHRTWEPAGRAHWLLLVLPTLGTPFIILEIEEYARTRRAGNEATVMEALRALSGAQDRFLREDIDDRVGRRDFTISTDGLVRFWHRGGPGKE